MNSRVILLTFSGLLLGLVTAIMPAETRAQTCSGGYTSRGLYRCQRNASNTAWVCPCATDGTSYSPCTWASSPVNRCAADQYIPEDCPCTASNCWIYNRFDGFNFSSCTTTYPPTNTPFLPTNTPWPTVPPPPGVTYTPVPTNPPGACQYHCSGSLCIPGGSSPPDTCITDCNVCSNPGNTPGPTTQPCTCGSCSCLGAPGDFCSASRIGNSDCPPDGPDGQACCIEDSPPGCCSTQNPDPTPTPVRCTIQGFKREEPSGFTGPPVGGLNITVNGGGNYTSNPYFITVIGNTTSSIATQIPAGYDAGYSTCLNQTTCHTPSFIQPYTGPVSAFCPAGGYNDFWFHYCRIPTAPTNISPSGVFCAPGGLATFTQNISWSSVPGATKYHYRLDDTTNGWTGTCSTVNPGDACVDNYPTNNVNLTVNVDRDYGFWVHSGTSCRMWGPAGSAGFRAVRSPRVVSGPTATADAATGNVVVSWSFSGANQYNLYRNGVLIAANAVSPYTDSLGVYSCGTLLIYQVNAFNDANPVSCQSASATTTTTVPCIYSSHFRGRGADIVAAGGPLYSSLPFQPTQKYLIDRDQYSNRAGMGIGNGFTSAVPALTSNNVSLDRWLVNHAGGWATARDRSENKYPAIRERILAQVNVYTIPAGDAVIPSQGNWDQLVSQARGANSVIDIGGSQQVVVIRKLGPGTVYLRSSAIPQEINMGATKALLLVDGGNVSIEASIRRDRAANGWLMILAEGDINVDRNVGHADTANVDISAPAYPPHLEGVYYAGGIFRTGGNCSGAIPDRQLRVDGTVIGMTGVSLCRNNLGANPSEYFWFRPEITLDLYQVGLRKKVTQELVAP